MNQQELEKLVSQPTTRTRLPAEVVEGAVVDHWTLGGGRYMMLITNEEGRAEYYCMDANGHLGAVED